MVAGGVKGHVEGTGVIELQISSIEEKKPKRSK